MDKKAKYFVLAFALFVSQFLLAQNQIAFKVTDIESGKPVPFSFIQYVNSELKFRTDSLGSKTIKHVPESIQHFRVSAVDYEEDTVEVKANHQTTVDVSLQRLDYQNYLEKRGIFPARGKNTLIVIVLDSVSKSPISSALVSVGSIAHYLRTDINGIVVFDSVGYDQSSVKATNIGYDVTLVKEFAISNSLTILRIKLFRGCFGCEPYAVNETKKIDNRFFQNIFQGNLSLNVNRVRIEPLGYETETDSTGNFEIENIPNGFFDVKFYKNNIFRAKKRMLFENGIITPVGFSGIDFLDFNQHESILQISTTTLKYIHTTDFY